MAINFAEIWSTFDWIIIVAYFVAIISVGLVMRKRASKNMKSFFVASRRLTIPVLVGVGAASWYDSWTIVGLAECGTTMGICMIFIYIIPTAILRLPLAVWIGPLVRNKIPDWVLTMPDLMAYMYDKKTKFVMALGMLPPFLYESALLTAGGSVIAYVTGMNMWVAFVLLGIIIIFYTSLSGLWGLAVTDMMQFVVMSVAAGVLCFGLMAHFGGFGSLFDQVGEVNPEFLTVTGGESPMSILGWIISALAIRQFPVISAIRIIEVRRRYQGFIHLYHDIRIVLQLHNGHCRNGCSHTLSGGSGRSAVGSFLGYRIHNTACGAAGTVRSCLAFRSDVDSQRRLSHMRRSDRPRYHKELLQAFTQRQGRSMGHSYRHLDSRTSHNHMHLFLGGRYIQSLLLLWRIPGSSLYRPSHAGAFLQKEDTCGRILEPAAHHCGLRRMGICSGNSLGHTCQCGLHHIQRHRICRCCQAYL